MGAFFERLWTFLQELQPVRIVRSFEQGVRFVNGQHSEKPLSAGVYAIEVVNCQEDVLDLPIQSITTTCGKQVSLSANVTFRVVDAVLNYTAVADFNENLQRLATRHVMYRVREWSWAELCEEQKKLESSLKDTLTTRAKKWGVEIIDVGFDTLVQARQYRIFGDGGML